MSPQKDVNEAEKVGSLCGGNLWKDPPGDGDGVVEDQRMSGDSEEKNQTNMIMVRTLLGANPPLRPSWVKQCASV